MRRSTEGKSSKRTKRSNGGSQKSYMYASLLERWSIKWY